MRRHRLNGAHPAGARGVALQLDDDVNGPVDLIPYGLHRKGDVRHGGERLQSAERIDRGIRVNSGE